MIRIDDIISLLHERDLDVLLLCETWHDSDSVCIRRLRADGMRVIERVRPHTIHNISTNHGGVVVAVSGNSRLQLVNTGGCRATFEHVSCRIASRQSSCVVLIVCRPGSDPICIIRSLTSCQMFFFA